MNKKRGLLIIFISSLIAILTSAYLLYSHYSDVSSFCDVSQAISCDIVNRSLYSEIFNIPVSLFALITFYIVNVLSLAALRNEKPLKLTKKQIYNIIFWLMILGILFALYLIYIEAFVLYAFCPLCLLLDILILIILVTVIKLRSLEG